MGAAHTEIAVLHVLLLLFIQTEVFNLLKYEKKAIFGKNRTLKK
jgi:hypothetical protein